MLPSPYSQVLGMTDLQKISAKRLQKLKKNTSPILVMDKKSGREVFVIMDWESYEHLRAAKGPAGRVAAPAVLPKISRKKNPLSNFDFAARGLLWDRPGMKNADFVKRLQDATHAEWAWAATRLFERLKSVEILNLLGWEGARALFEKTRLRPALKEPWKDAFTYRDQKARCVTRDASIDSLRDLTSNKINCLFQRQEPKDYVDFFYLYPAIGLSLKELFMLAEKKDGGFDPLILAHQIKFLLSVPKAPEFFTANVPWQHVQDFYQRLHDDILNYLGA